MKNRMWLVMAQLAAFWKTLTTEEKESWTAYAARWDLKYYNGFTKANIPRALAGDPLWRTPP